MTIKTRYEIGDEIYVNGEKHKIISVHLYESELKHTERYYIGKGLWVTICKERKENEYKRWIK